MSALPKSKATTAYELLSEVRRLILEEPKRYNQEHVFTDPVNRNAPQCGTIACVAGWVAVLKGLDRNRDIMSQAANVLGIDDTEADELFSGAAIDEIAGCNTAPMIGTPEYASYGAQHIAKFQKKYAAQLKAKRV